MADSFNPDLPSDVAADAFRRKVADMMIEASRNPAFTAMTPHEQLGAFMAGVLTGLVGVMFVYVDEPGHDGAIAAILEYLPDARAQAEGIIAGGGEAAEVPFQ